jgi:hypothetical protein
MNIGDIFEIDVHVIKIIIFRHMMKKTIYSVHWRDIDSIGNYQMETR